MIEREIIMSNQISINKKSIMDLPVLLFFIVSLFNSIGLLLFMLILFYYGLKSSLNAIKVLNIITLRSVLNPGLTISISQFELLKWLLLFVCAGRLIIDYFKIEEKDKLNKMLFPVVLYLTYSALSSFIFSNLPIVA